MDNGRKKKEKTTRCKRCEDRKREKRRKNTQRSKEDSWEKGNSTQNTRGRRGKARKSRTFTDRTKKGSMNNEDMETSERRYEENRRESHSHNHSNRERLPWQRVRRPATLDNRPPSTWPNHAHVRAPIRIYEAANGVAGTKRDEQEEEKVTTTQLENEDITHPRQRFPNYDNDGCETDGTDDDWYGSGEEEGNEDGRGEKPAGTDENSQ